VDKRTGTDRLAHPEPGELAYPNTGGERYTLHPGHHGREMALTWTLARATPDEVELTATAAGGITLTRTVRLTADGLSTRARVTNGGTAPALLALRGAVDIAPGSIDPARVLWQPASGAAVEKALTVANEQPTGSETLTGARLPAGEWRLQAPAGVVRQLFDPALAPRAVLNWTAKGVQRVTFNLWTAERTLAPGESLALAAALLP
jgi:hypothetical protein